MKLDILVFGSHPDDAELGAGATIAKEVANGKKVGIVDLTRGELGTRGAEILGIAVRENLGFADAFFTNDRKHQLEVIKMIRKYRPDIVLCNAVEDRHIDHAKGSTLVSDACFLSGLVKVETKLDGGEQGQGAWRPKLVYHYIQWKNLKPDFVVDVSDYMEIKTRAIMAYDSQFYDPDSKEPETPISSKNFTDSVLYRARDLGRLIGVEYGEGFTAERYVAVKDLGNLI
jgi:bacillithiol biosynthesis deacetylase BshB1